MTGHVRKRLTKGGKVRWDVVLDLGRSPAGKRVQKNAGAFATEREAGAKLREYLH